MGRWKRKPLEDPKASGAAGTRTVSLRRLRAERARAKAQARKELAALLEKAGVVNAPHPGQTRGEDPPASAAAGFRRRSRLLRAASRCSLRGRLDEDDGVFPVDPADLGLVDIEYQEITSIFDALRAAGIKPHPWAEREGESKSAIQDRILAQRIVAALRRLRNQGLVYVPEENLAPNAEFGVLNAMCILDGDVQADTEGAEEDKTSAQYGYAWDVVADIAMAGGGLIRHPHAPDLSWYHLDHEAAGGDDLFPAPADMMAAMSADRWARLARFTLFTVVCYLAEMKLMGILFSYGPEAVPGAALEENIDREIGYSADTDWDGFKRRLLQAGPEWQNSLLFLSGRGWDSFYWDHEEARGDFEEYFQRFCLCFWSGGGAYSDECARRKSLGAAAYGQALGTFFNALNAVFQSDIDSSVTLADIVPTLEVGNEWESTWYNYSATPSGEPDGNANNTARFGELARLLVMVTAPIRHLCADIPFTFRFPDLLGWTGDEGLFDWNVPRADWYKRVIWVEHVLREGVVDECARLDRFQDAELLVRLTGANPATVEPGNDFPDWYATCLLAGFVWPQCTSSGFIDFNPTGLVQEVGFHFWHATTSDDRYQDEARIKADFEYWNSQITDNPVIRARFGQLASSVSGIQFQALAPDVETEDNVRLGAYVHDNNPTFQAGMLVRRLLFIRAIGSRRVLWHTFMSGIKNKGAALGIRNRGAEGWGYSRDSHARGQFNANGLRNDICDSDHAYSPYPNSAERFTHEQHAWRRPAWFTYRRLLWLLSQATMVAVVHCSEGAVLIRLYSSTGFTNPTGVIVGAEPRPIAWVAWLDQDAAREQWSFHLVTSTDIATSSFRVLSLVAAQALCGIQASPDGGYPEGDDDLDWIGDGFGQTTSSAAADSTGILMTINRASPDNPAPLCILTDGGYEVSSMVAGAAENLGESTHRTHEVGRQVQGPNLDDSVLPPSGTEEPASGRPRRRKE